MENFEKARFSKILKNELFEKLSEPSRAELFDQKLEPKSELSEPSLGSGATLVKASFKSVPRQPYFEFRTTIRHWLVKPFQNKAGEERFKAGF